MYIYIYIYRLMYRTELGGWPDLGEQRLERVIRILRTRVCARMRVYIYIYMYIYIYIYILYIYIYIYFAP